MIRVLFTVFALAVGVTVVTGLSARWTVPLAIGAVVVMFAGGQRLRCPKCRKRIKLGASVCHHCGFDTVAKRGSPTSTSTR